MGLIKAPFRLGGFAEIDGYVSANNRGIPRAVNIASLIRSKAGTESPAERRGRGVGKRGILGRNSKSFTGKGGEEIADWTLRVSNYFYCPHSPSFLAQSGLLGSSKKCSPCHSSPQGDAQVSVTLWGENMLSACQQHYPTIVIISTIIPSIPTLTTGMVKAGSFLMPLSNQDHISPGCMSACVCVCVPRCMFAFKST